MYKCLFCLCLFLYSTFGEPCSNLENTKWVLFAYRDVSTQEDIVLKESDYLTGCSVKYVLSFNKKRKMVLEINDKWTRTGQYKIKESCGIEIAFPVYEKIVDGESNCHIDTGRLIDVGYSIKDAISYQVNGDTLVLHCEAVSNNKRVSESMRFKRVH